MRHLAFVRYISSRTGDSQQSCLSSSSLSSSMRLVAGETPFHARDEHNREFQALAVECHEDHPVPNLLGIINISHQ